MDSYSRNGSKAPETRWRQCPKLRSLLISEESSKTIGNLQQLPKALLALDAGSTPVAAHLKMWEGPI